MSETNFDWDDLRLFLAVARSGGLAAAALVTEKSAPTLGRRMIALERRLGLELFVRQARGYTLTESGNALLQTALSLENTIQPVITDADTQTKRRVKISAGSWVSMFLSRNISRLSNDKSIVLQFIAADHVLDIAHREAVIGIRNKRPESTGLAGRQINQVEFAVYAKDENVSDWVQVIGSTPSARWTRQQCKESPAIEVTSPRNALDIALTGTAKVVLPTFVGDSADGLVQISDNIPELTHTQWLVTHHEDRHQPEVRFVIEQLAVILAE